MRALGNLNVNKHIVLCYAVCSTRCNQTVVRVMLLHVQGSTLWHHAMSTYRPSLLPKYSVDNEANDRFPSCMIQILEQLYVHLRLTCDSTCFRMNGLRRSLGLSRGPILGLCINPHVHLRKKEQSKIPAHPSRGRKGSD